MSQKTNSPETLRLLGTRSAATTEKPLKIAQSNLVHDTCDFFEEMDNNRILKPRRIVPSYLRNS
jgi:hypothetical protein